MATIDIYAGCGGYYAYTLYYSSSSCGAACSSGSSVTVYSTCSSLTSSCVLYDSNGNYADVGYYSDGTNCFTVVNN